MFQKRLAKENNVTANYSLREFVHAHQNWDYRSVKDYCVSLFEIYDLNHLSRFVHHALRGFQSELLRHERFYDRLGLLERIEHVFVGVVLRVYVN